MPLGFMLPHVAREFGACPGWVLDESRTSKTLTLSAGPDRASRSEVIASTLAHFKENGTFRILKHWRSEQKPCYGPAGEVLFTIERAAFPLLGIVAYGVIFIAYTVNWEGSVAGLWVQKRSSMVKTHVGLYDGTVAGGMAVDKTPFQTLVTEAAEEASLSGELIYQKIRTCGTLSYFHTRKAEMGGEVGLLQPGVHFLYEMQVPEDIEPEAGDESTAGFDLLTLKEIKEQILAGHVKPWFALAVIDFFYSSRDHDRRKRARLHRNFHASSSQSRVPSLQRLISRKAGQPVIHCMN
ncbi:hypothetical protein ONZ43_g5934 [Nemania bipapillata]|uniref:Uncharacterized protein n=1 Tax=Nemania bipapillata TaxID=110536 RepID=A0ACC2I4C5_9PEZI|nr:hypothetical protein ONZ43_g5934 [Nemania bipapillata]